jgi:catechol 2,3-dioxygenase-like lactoylglutathione lyase family enzyme
MTISPQSSAPDVVALRPFVPAKDFEKSLRFYVDLGFSAHRLGDSLAAMELGPFGFLLQQFEAKGFAGNFMMHLLVNDVQGWWKRIEGLDLAGKYGVKAPSAPALQPWGLTVAYVVDPSGVLWHIAQNPPSTPTPVVP